MSSNTDRHHSKSTHSTPPKKLQRVLGENMIPQCDAGTNACNWFLPWIPSTTTFAWRSLNEKSFTLVLTSYHSRSKRRLSERLVSYWYQTYKGSTPGAADAVRYARARNNVKGGRKKRPMIWCEQRIDNAKSCLCRPNCPVQCCVLVDGVTF